MMRNYSPLFLLGAVVCFLTGSVEAVDHIVGGSFGWTIPQNASYYNDCAKTRIFHVGEKLVFLFRTSRHNVVEVDGQKDFDGCTQDNTINTYSTGTTLAEIKEAGDTTTSVALGATAKQAKSLASKPLVIPTIKHHRALQFEIIMQLLVYYLCKATLFI